MENMFVGILVSGACGCAAPSEERFMSLAVSREGSPSQA